jgi:cbb3-type cytochrome oxidase subunit 3
MKKKWFQEYVVDKLGLYAFILVSAALIWIAYKYGQK